MDLKDFLLFTSPEKAALKEDFTQKLLNFILSVTVEFIDKLDRDTGIE